MDNLDIECMVKGAQKLIEDIVMVYDDVQQCYPPR